MNPKILHDGEGQRQNAIGDNQTVKLTGEDTGGAFVMVTQENSPGIGVPMHIHHNEDELFHIIEGSMAFTVGGESVKAEAGTSVFLPRDIPHEFMVTGEKPAKTIVMTFPAGIEHMFRELAALPAGPPEMEKVLEICGRYGIEFLAPPNPSEDDLAGV